MAVAVENPPLVFSDKRLLRPLMDALAEEMGIPRLPHASAREAQRLIAIDLAKNGIDIKSRPFNADLENMRESRWNWGYRSRYSAGTQADSSSDMHLSQAATQ